MATEKGKTAKQWKALGVEPQAGHVWLVKTASGHQVTARLLREAYSRGQWYALNLETNRDVRVKSRGFIRRLDPPPPAMPGQTAQAAATAATVASMERSSDGIASWSTRNGTAWWGDLHPRGHADEDAARQDHHGAAGRVARGGGRGGALEAERHLAAGERLMDSARAPYVEKVERGERFRKRLPARSGRTKPEHRGKHSVVEVLRVDGTGIVSVKIVEGPTLFSRRMSLGVLLRDFERVEHA